MRVRNSVFLIGAILALALAVMGCGAAATPTPKPTVAPPTAVPTATAAPTATPLPPTPVPTPVPPQATAKQQVNLRTGPGDKFAVAGKMNKDTTAVVIGKSEDAKWLQLAYPTPDKPSWVLATFVTVSGSLDPVAVVVPSPTPTNAPGTRAATAVAKATATATIQPIPPARGILGYVAYEDAIQSYSLYNFQIADKVSAAFKQMGPQPSDVEEKTNASPFTWARDGSKIAYTLGVLGATKYMKITDGSGTELFSYGHAVVLSPSFSPDSQRLVYAGRESNGAENLCLVDFRIPFNPKNCGFFPARQTGGTRESFRGAAFGKWIYFVSNLSGAFEIWRMNEDGSGPTQLTTDRRENGSPAISPDGTRLAYYSKQAEGGYAIMVANADGSAPRKLTSGGNNFTPVWSPDGNWIAYFSSSTGQIHIVDKNGNNSQALFSCKAPLTRCQLPGAWR